MVDVDAVAALGYAVEVQVVQPVEEEVEEEEEEEDDEGCWRGWWDER